MLHTMWSVKGGSGVSVTVALSALSLARRDGRALVVDLRGDQPAVLGLAEPARPGVRDWLASTDSSAAALARLIIEVGDGLWLLPAGTAVTWPPHRVAQLVEALSQMQGQVVIDAGLIDGPGVTDHPVVALGHTLAAAGTSLLVMHPCYLALRRAMAAELAADGVVVLVDSGRSVGGDQIARSLRLPVVATIVVDPAVARSVDSGMLVRRSHRSVERSLRDIA